MAGGVKGGQRHKRNRQEGKQENLMHWSFRYRPKDSPETRCVH